MTIFYEIARKDEKRPKLAPEKQVFRKQRSRQGSRKGVAREVESRETEGT